jgi:hypothetical protein
MSYVQNKLYISNENNFLMLNVEQETPLLPGEIRKLKVGEGKL